MSAAFGVGGATISTPGIRALGASAFVAVGTTLPSILPSAISGTLRYMREGLVDWQVVKWAAPVGVATSILGSLLSHIVPGNGHWLMIATALLLGATAWLAMSGAYLPMLRFYRCPILLVPLLPAIALFYTAATVGSAIQFWRGRGGRWKGRYQAAASS